MRAKTEIFLCFQISGHLGDKCCDIVGNQSRWVRFMGPKNHLPGLTSWPGIEIKAEILCPISTPEKRNPPGMPMKRLNRTWRLIGKMLIVTSFPALYEHLPGTHNIGQGRGCGLP